jgi:ABC-2 type transport system permease protein
VLRPEVNLAAANGLWVVLLLVSGMLAPLSKLPSWLGTLSKALPAASLSDALHSALGGGALGAGGGVPGRAWLVLALWAVAAPAAAAATFRWE